MKHELGEYEILLKRLIEQIRNNKKKITTSYTDNEKVRDYIATYK